MNSADRCATPEGSSSHALVIGISYFDHLASRYLLGCLNDAVEMCNFLVDRVQVPPENVRLLLSQAPKELAPNEQVTRENLSPRITWNEQRDDARTATIHGAFEDLLKRVRTGDRVFIYYATHGARLVSPNGAWSYVLLPQDFPAVADLGGPKANWRQMITAGQLGHYLRALSEKADLSVIADTCHSASSTRDLDAEDNTRSVHVPQPTPEQWQQFEAAHPSWAVPAVAEASQDSSGFWGLQRDRDWVHFAACRESESAYPCRVKNERGQEVPHGLFTAKLLEQLRSTQVPVSELRWLDIQLAVRDAVRKTRQNSDQTPVLDGRSESTVFGGRWTPFDPGYTVHVGRDGELTVDAGFIHGLAQGAVIEIYPPNTARFADAVASSVEVAVAVVEKAEPTQSTVKLQSGPAPLERSRARLRTPSQKTPRLRVRLPADIAAADVLQPGDEAVLEVVGAAEPAQIDVRPWQYEYGAEKGRSRPVQLSASLSREGSWRVSSWEGGWVLCPGDRVALRPAGVELGTSDVIAYLPPVSAAQDATQTGQALRCALRHLAEQRRLLDSAGRDEALQSSLRFELLVGDDRALQRVLEGQKPPAPRSLEAGTAAEAGPVLRMTQDERLLLALHIKPWRVSGQKLCLGVLAASQDGEIVALWPKADQEASWAFIGKKEPAWLGSGNVRPDLSLPEEVKYVGWNNTPLQLTARDDQPSGRFTLKIIVAAVGKDDPPVDVRKLALPHSVQTTIGECLATSGRDIGGSAPPPALPLSYSWSIHIAVSKDAMNNLRR